MSIYAVQTSRFSFFVVCFILSSFLVNACKMKYMTDAQLEEFKEKIKADLPIGTPCEVVTQYVERLDNARYSFHAETNTIYIIVKDVRTTLFVHTSLSIVVALDKNKNVRSLSFELQADGL